MTTAGAQLRALIEAPEITVLPGVHDTLSALIAQSCGAKAIATGGYSATASLLGRPDGSQLSLTELGDYYARIAERVEIPMLADGDTGFGNVTNVARTVKVLERSGVGGFFIEDQLFPKRCGHMVGKAIIGIEEMAGKLKAALDARQGDTMIMARTDAIATEGFQEALDRMALYREVYPLQMAQQHSDRDRLLAEAEQLLIDRGVVDKGDLIVLTIGEPIGCAGGTNTLKIVRVGEHQIL